MQFSRPHLSHNTIVLVLVAFQAIVGSWCNHNHFDFLIECYTLLTAISHRNIQMTQIVKKIPQRWKTMVYLCIKWATQGDNNIDSFCLTHFALVSPYGDMDVSRTAPNHYLHQYWFFISKVLWYLPQQVPKLVFSNMSLGMKRLKVPNLSGASASAQKGLTMCNHNSTLYICPWNRKTTVLLFSCFIFIWLYSRYCKYWACNMFGVNSIDLTLCYSTPGKQ